MEATLFGDVVEGANSEERLLRVESVYTRRPGASDTVDKRVNNMLTSIYFAPVVELPAPHGFAAFVPWACVGVFPTKVGRITLTWLEWTIILRINPLPSPHARPALCTSTSRFIPLSRKKISHR
jgi:hypothetical protein